MIRYWWGDIMNGKKEMKPSKDDFKDWKNNPTTKWVFEELELMIIDYSKALGEGSSLYPKSSSETAAHYANTVGFIDGLKALTKLEVKE